MYYYFVWVRSNRYHGSEPLTYASEVKLSTGRIVVIELQKELVLGVVSGVTTKPRFKTKQIHTIYDIPPLPAHLLKVAAWLQQYYPAPLGIIAQQLVPAHFSAKQLAITDSPKFDEPSLAHLPSVTKEQQAALEAMQDPTTYVLHGKTGSGKTRVYIELAIRSFNAGKSSIILTPEISLTTQLANSFRSVFGNRVVVLHSQQTPAERQHAWLACLRATEPVIVIGPRSALFSPIAKLGLIVVDEAHEAAYKQEQSPQYQTGRVAAYLSRLAKATLILGSATPSISDYYMAEQKQKSIITMNDLAQANDHPAVVVQTVDRKDRSQFTRSSSISQALIEAIEKALNRGEQSLLYLNRRGTARLILCQDCGWQANCPHCDIPLTYHGDSHSLRCHTCTYKTAVLTSCPDCGNTDIVYRSAGTKAVVDEAQRLFPQGRIARFDTDNAKADRFEQHYDAVKAGDVDIIVGTQLLAKGLDLPRLSTLGVLLADTSLYMPDFAAPERTFQLLTQVLGRVGRGHSAGTAIIQTYHPNHPVIQAAINNDYAGFYKTELLTREDFAFPPFVHLLKITLRRASIAATETAAEKLKSELQSLGLPILVEGPAPSFYEKFQNKYQWQLVIKSHERSALLKVIAALPGNCSYDIDPMDLL